MALTLLNSWGFWVQGAVMLSSEGDNGASQRFGLEQIYKYPGL